MIAASFPRHDPNQHRSLDVLLYLGRLINTRSYDERYKLLNPPKDRKSFIYDVLYPGRHREHTPDGILQVAYNEEQMKKLVRLPIIIDSDPGPAEVWRVAHLNKSCDEFVFSFYQHFKSTR